MKMLPLILLSFALLGGCEDKANPTTKSDSQNNELEKQQINLEDPEKLDRILEGAIDDDQLQERGKEGEELLYAPNSQTPFTGWTKVMYRNGQVRSLIPIKEGKLQGLRTSWYENGQKYWEINFKEGKPHGLATTWHENGQKESEGNFKDGEKHGLMAKWYEDGQKRTGSQLRERQKPRAVEKLV